MSFRGANISVHNVEGHTYHHGPSQRSPAYGPRPATHQGSHYPGFHSQYSQQSPDQYSHPRGPPNPVHWMQAGQGSGGGYGGGNSSYYADNSMHDNSAHHIGDTYHEVTYNSGSQSNIGRMGNANFGTNYGTISQSSGIGTQSGLPSRQYYHPSANGPETQRQLDYSEQPYEHGPDYGDHLDYGQGYRDNLGPEVFQQQGQARAQPIEATVDTRAEPNLKSKNPYYRLCADTQPSSSSSAIPPLPPTSGSRNSRIPSTTQERGTAHHLPPSDSYSQEHGQTGAAKRASANVPRPDTRQEARRRAPKPAPPPDSDLELEWASETMTRLKLGTYSNDEASNGAVPTGNVDIQIERLFPASSDEDTDIRHAEEVVRRDEGELLKRSSKTGHGRSVKAIPVETSTATHKGSAKRDIVSPRPRSDERRASTESAPPTRTRRVSFASETQVREFDVEQYVEEPEERKAASDEEDQLPQASLESSGGEDERGGLASKSDLKEVQSRDDESPVGNELSGDEHPTSTPEKPSYEGCSLFDDDYDTDFLLGPPPVRVPSPALSSPASVEGSSSGLDQSEKDSLRQAGSASSSSLNVSALVSAPSPTVKEGRRKSRGMSIGALKKAFGGGKDKKGKGREDMEESDYGVVGAPGVRDDGLL